MEDADIVTSVQALRTMLAFVDGTLTEDRSWLGKGELGENRIRWGKRAWYNPT